MISNVCPRAASSSNNVGAFGASGAPAHRYALVASDFNLHLLEIAQANMNAAFDFARQLAGIKSPSEFFELSTAHARKQFETFTEQSQRLTNLAQKAASDAAQLLQSEVAKTFKKSA